MEDKEIFYIRRLYNLFRFHVEMIKKDNDLTEEEKIKQLELIKQLLEIVQGKENKLVR